MAPTGRRGRVVSIPHNSMEHSLQKLVKTFECDTTVESLDTNILSRYSSPIGGMAQTGRCRLVVPIPRNSPRTASRNTWKLFSAIQRSDRSLDTDLLTRYSGPFGGMAPTVHHRRVVPIPRNFMENSFLKLVKKFECDPTVGSLDTDLLSRYSGPVGGKAPTEHRRHVVLSPQTPWKIASGNTWKHLRAIQRSDL